MAGNFEWKTAIKSITEEKQTCLKGVTVENHPLKINQITVTERIPRRILSSQPSTGQTTPISTPNSILEPLSAALEGLDPLTQFALQETDPLSQMVAEMVLQLQKLQESENANSVKKSRDKNMHLEPDLWNERKYSILSKFTTSEKICIITSFLSEGEKVVVKAQSSAVDKVQHRLEQLDNFEDGSQRKLNLTQAEYTSRIQQLNNELVSAWHSEQRVKSLKIAIQCAKLLSDTDVLRFYPSKFVLITDILDIFGQLVYDRLRMKADYLKPGSRTPTALPEDFTPDMVPEAAKETCRNWFFKIASIRELVPRIYVEMALLKCYRFLATKESHEALLRLTRMIHGIGNPLVAVYARCYLARVALKDNTSKYKSMVLIQNFTNFLESYDHLFSRCVDIEISKQKMEMPAYMTLFTPALEFMLQSFSPTSSESLLLDLLDKCSQHGNSSLILNSIMAAFKPSYIAVRSIQLLKMIGDAQKHDLPQYILLRTLGLCISIWPPLQEHRRDVLGLAWNYIASITIPEQYISCAEIWIKYTVQYFTIREINVILGDIIEHMSMNRAYEQHYTQLKQIVETIVSHIQDYESILAIDYFLPLIDLFKQETIKVDVCKLILTSCNNEHHTSDAVITNALIFLCTVLHDSVNALTVEDELRQIGSILCNVVKSVDYGWDFEQQLNFYVEARAAFSNIDAVLIQLVHCVNLLAVNTRKIVKGSHSRKTADFVRACAAYCFITIPCLVSVRQRLDLYLLSGRVALFNQCLGQADACFDAAINIIKELHQEENNRNSELYLVSYARSFLSTLLVVPDNPQQGVLKLTRKLLKALQGFEWEDQSSNLTVIYMNVLDMLSTMAQVEYPYHVDKIESNDALYGSDPKFITEVNRMCTLILGEVLSLLKRMGPTRKQSALAIELMTRVAVLSDLKSSSMQTLVINLWQLSLKHGQGDLKYMERIRNYLMKRGTSAEHTDLQELVKRFNFP